MHEDADILVLEKPVGLITADPNTGRFDGPRSAKTLFDLVKKYTAGKSKKRRGSPPSCYIIHRLDKDASGLIVFAKTPEAFARLKEHLKSKRIGREYLAVAEGIVGSKGDEGTIDLPIRDDSPDRGPDPNRPAVTHYRVLESAGDRTLLEVRLETGRKNQIRAHFSMTGHPLIGDGRFNAGTNPIGRLGLHAWRLAFEHPRTGREMIFEAPPPASFHRAVGLKSLPTSGSASPSTPATERPAHNKSDTSWEPVANWYDTLLEDQGSDHHRDTIFPGVLRLLALQPGARFLDVACGQGQLCRLLNDSGVDAVGIDASPSLIERAQVRSADGARSPMFTVCDARTLEKSGLAPTSFDAAACVMALSNIEPIEPVLKGIARLLKPNSAFVLVITHPAFRAIGGTSWGWDDQRRRQFRRVDAYLSPTRSDIATHPGKAARGQKGGDLKTVTFHRPIGHYVRALASAGLYIDALEEWPSTRTSDSGPRASEENRSRREIPLFLAVRARRTM